MALFSGASSSQAGAGTAPAEAPPQLWRSALMVAWQLAFTTLALALSWLGAGGGWLVGQLLLSVNMLQWFLLMHEFGHRSFFRSEGANTVLGHLASLFCLLPYYPWRYVHHAHHKWTGWRGQDPTIPEVRYEALRPWQIYFIDFCWRYWIPVFALSFSAQTFFNLRRLFRLFPQPRVRRRLVFSLVFLVGVMLALPLLLGLGLFVKLWGLAFFLFIFISDPLLLSQHTHLDYLDDVDPAASPKPVRYVEQPFFTRSVTYPPWVARYVLYYFNRHGLHHQFPWVPSYRLGRLPEPPEHQIAWHEWLSLAKRMPGHELIFLSTRHTGISL